MTAPRTAPMARLSLRALFFLGQLPLLVFALGIAATTVAVLALVDAEVRKITGGMSLGAEVRGAVEAMGDAFVQAWLMSLAAFFVLGGLGSCLVAWTQRALSARIARIVGHARHIGAGQGTLDLRAEADDALGQLEEALAQVAAALATRDAARQAEQAAREQIARIQRAMSMVDAEADAQRLVQRALQQLAPGQPAELLMAAGADAALAAVAVTPGVAAPGCGVASPPKCPAVQLGATLIFADGEALDACPRLHDRAQPCAAACVPVTVMGRSAGVLHTTRPRGQPPEAALITALETLSGAFGARVGLLRTLESTQRLAGTDALTGLANRRHLEDKAVALLASCPRVAVVMADLDKFKLLNDTHGHAAGDQALQRFAQVLRSSTRPGDVYGRWGGEEFFLLLPDCSGQEAVAVLDRLRGNLARQAGAGGVPPFTASFGVAEFPTHSVSFDELVQIADKALYRAKELGRDRVEVGA